MNQQNLKDSYFWATFIADILNSQLADFKKEAY